jgi:hypothetical protein
MIDTMFGCRTRLRISTFEFQKGSIPYTKRVCEREREIDTSRRICSCIFVGALQHFCLFTIFTATCGEVSAVPGTTEQHAASSGYLLTSSAVQAELDFAKASSAKRLPGDVPFTWRDSHQAKEKREVRITFPGFSVHRSICKAHTAANVSDMTGQACKEQKLT